MVVWGGYPTRHVFFGHCRLSSGLYFPRTVTWFSVFWADMYEAAMVGMIRSRSVSTASLRQQYIACPLMEQRLLF